MVSSEKLATSDVLWVESERSRMVEVGDIK
jgi:hypothetical protein